MAQSGFTPIVTYHSTVASAVPSNANTQAGELAMNIADMKLYTENSGGTITLLASADAAAGNFTTVDTTNLEVTNIKAKDGTASATIANATGVMTIGSSVLTTTDINGGTIDGTAIGGSTPAAGAFTTLSASGTLSVNSNNISADNSLGFRNRIINGDMRIDQRNAGASITPTATVYSVDRWQATVNVASKASFDQTTTAPAGFTNSMLITSLSAYSVAAGDIATYRQQIEGFNVADLGWGTASAKTVTVSFWVRSSLTGTFGGSVKNGASTRSYPFTYTISVADTFEYKTVTIAGDTSGTWATDNTSGLILSFGIGVGSTTSGTAGAWAGTNYNSATGATSILATNGATFYLTGVQLEVGSVATPFERRPYWTELSLCQRYYEKTLNQGTTSSSGQTSGALIAIAVSSTQMAAQWTFKQTKRATPTLTLSSFNGTAGSWANFGNTDFAVTQPWGVGDNGFARLDSTGMTAGAGYWGFATASAEL